jgi:tetratricopeptide (TPR) repeat protein
MIDKNNHKDTIFNVRIDILACLFIVITTLAVYWQVRHHAFINLDDNMYILKNQYVRGGLTLKGISWAFSFPGFDYWHPLTWLSHMLDCHLYGLQSGMHHESSLILHIVNGMLLFLIFERMTEKVWRSALVAALFALHPLNVESVVWLAERKNVLSTFFGLLTILTYIHYTERPVFSRYLLVFFVFALGLMSKPMLVTVPFVLLLLDYWPLGRFKLAQAGSVRNRKALRSTNGGIQRPHILRLILEKIPLLVLSMVAIILSSLALQRLGSVVSTESVSLKLRFANALVSYISYIKKMIWPLNLSVYYPYPQAIPLWQVAGAGLLLVLISVLVSRAIKTKPYLVVGWLWYIGTLVPAIGLVQAGLWPAIADRFAYVPLIGLFIIIAWGIPDIVAGGRNREIKLTTIAAALLATLMVTSKLQVGHWRNSITLFEHAIEITDNNHIAHQKLGEALEAQGETAEAIRHYSEALRIKPDFLASHLDLGILLRGEGNLDEAIRHLSKVISLKPDYVEAHDELGIALDEQGSFDAAVSHFHEAIRIKPGYINAHIDLGIALALQGKDKEAIDRFNKALRIDYRNVDAYFNLGKIYFNQGKIEKSILNYHRALHFSPNMTQALYNLSWISATYKDEKFRNGKEAVWLAEKLCKITQYNQPLAFDALAAAYAETGRFDAAVLTAKKALKLALIYGPNELVSGLKKRLQLYQAGLPYRQS